MSLSSRMHKLVKKIDRLEQPRLSREISPCGSEYSAAAALAKMAGKKKGQENISLQIEVETEMQWRTLLRREGLIVVDVYAGWAGPCTSMISILKRVKVEINDERLWLAVACSDNISDLLMFKDQSEPTWLFIGGGKPVKVFRGSNAPKLISVIKSEFANELLCMQGKAKRTLISIDDEVSRRRKAEEEAIKLAKMIKEEDETAEELNNLRKESSVRLMGAMEPYTVLVVQNFLLETGAVTEIRDYLMGEFKIEQERYVNLDEEGVRRLFRIPYEIPDPNEPDDFGYYAPEEPEQSAGGGADGVGSFDDDNMTTRSGQSGRNSIDGSEYEEAVPVVQPVKKKKMIPVKVPPTIVGDTLVMLLESIEIRKMMSKGIKPQTPLENADDYIRLKVGPVNLKDALEHAPYSLHAIYGQGEYQSGVWCPRKYDDKRYLMINFFPRFVTEMLMPPPTSDPKYALAIYPADKAKAVPRQLEIHKKDVLAQGKVKLSPDLIESMLKSKDLVEGEAYETAKKALAETEVFAISVDRRNSEVMMALKANDPVHISADQTMGKMETAKIFTSLNISLDGQADPDEVVEKFLARSKKRIQTYEDLHPKKPEPRKPEQSYSTSGLSDDGADGRPYESGNQTDQESNAGMAASDAPETSRPSSPPKEVSPESHSLQSEPADAPLMAPSKTSNLEETPPPPEDSQPEETEVTADQNEAEEE